MQNQTLPPKNLCQKSRQNFAHFLELRKNEDLLLARRYFLADAAQLNEFSTVFLIPRIVSEPLRGMIANLF